MKAIVTGGTGFIGSHVVDLLKENGYQVAVMDLQPPGVFWSVPAGVDVLEMDVATEECEDFIAAYQPDAIFHLAARASVVDSIHNPHEDARTTIDGMLRVLEGARRAKTNKVIFSSTAAVYGNPNVAMPIGEGTAMGPISPYGASKMAAEYYLLVYRELYNIDFAILRYANVYGPRQGISGEGGVIAIFTKAAIQGKTLRLFGDGGHTRDYIYVADVARANLLSAQTDGSFVLNISTGTETSNRELIDFIQGVAGHTLDVSQEPERPGDIRRSALAPNSAFSTIGFNAETGIRDGLEETYQWMRNWVDHV